VEATDLAGEKRRGGLWSHVAGLQPDLATPGWDHFFVAPKQGSGLSWVKAAYPSLRGTIEMRRKTQGDAYTLTIVVPPGATATVSVAGLAIDTILESGMAVTRAPSVVVLGQSDGNFRFKVGSGTYHFRGALPLSKGLDNRR